MIELRQSLDAFFNTYMEKQMKKSKSGFVPRPYRVFVSWIPSGKKEWHTQRTGGGFASVEEAEEYIAKEKRESREFDHTYGGLLPRFPEEKKEYSIWHAEWTPVKVL